MAEKKEQPAPDAAVAVSAADLKRLIDAAVKHVGNDPELGAAIAPFRAA